MMFGIYTRFISHTLTYTRCSGNEHGFSQATGAVAQVSGAAAKVTKTATGEDDDPSLHASALPPLPSLTCFPSIANSNTIFFLLMRCDLAPCEASDAAPPRRGELAHKRFFLLPNGAQARLTSV